MSAAIRPRDALLGAAAPTGALAAYHLGVRPWHLSWGATDEEANAVMAGDELLPAPTVVSTRAITLPAAAEEVWPWLVQIGQDRGGLYSYTVLENLFGLDIHNADRIHPEWQQLAVGDRVMLSKKQFALVVKILEPPHALVYSYADGGWTWAFELHDTDPGQCRLVVRNRWTSDWSGPARKVLFWGMEPAAFIMEQRMLRGIRQRVDTAA